MPVTDDASPREQMFGMAELKARFDYGVTLHQQGKLAEAERIYGEILERQPNHFDALHLLGVLAVQTGRTERGVGLIKQAIAMNAGNAVAHNHLGNALTELRRADEALASYDRAIALKADY